MIDPVTAAYIERMPEVETARLPLGALFFANGRIYKVIETGAGGFHKAREWRKTEETDVALIPGSFPSRYLPLVARGRLLPVYRTRLALTENQQPSCYVFPIETLALDAAYLDVELIQSKGAYVRNHGKEPAFVVTDGVHIFRLYYYRLSATRHKTDLSHLEVRPLPFKPRKHTEGPGYWRLLPTWTLSVPDFDTTVNMRRPSFDAQDTVPHVPPVPKQE